MSYQPRPIDTDDIDLPQELIPLTEKLAENTLALWAAQRIKDGWTIGEKRDHAAKKHPCLIPYAELPKSEKEYDRQTAVGTLRAILSLGYRTVNATLSQSIDEAQQRQNLHQLQPQGKQPCLEGAPDTAPRGF